MGAPNDNEANLRRDLDILLSNTQESFIMVDRNFRILTFNDQLKKEYKRIYGKDVRKGESLMIYALQEEASLKRILLNALEGKKHERELRVEDEGKIKWFQVQYSPAYDKNGKIIGVFISTDDITIKKKNDQEITKAIIKAQEQERFQIGAELHDNVNQILATAQLSLSMTNNPSSAQAEVWVEKSKEYIKMAMSEIRRISHSLAPASFENSSLTDAFDTLLYSFNVNNKYQIVTSYDELDEKVSISNDIQLNLFRILQELLKNILKYSNATRIEIGLKLHKGKIIMRVFDNGRGFDIDLVKRGIGLRNIKKRTELFMGTCSIHSSIGNGCEVIIEIPLESVIQKET